MPYLLLYCPMCMGEYRPHIIRLEAGLSDDMLAQSEPYSVVDPANSSPLFTTALQFPNRVSLLTTHQGRFIGSE